MKIISCLLSSMFVYGKILGGGGQQKEWSSSYVGLVTIISVVSLICHLSLLVD